GELLEVDCVEAQCRQVFDELLETRRDEKSARRRQPPNEELEHGFPAHAAVEIRLQHRELIEVRAERARCAAAGIRCHRTGPSGAASSVCESRTSMPRVEHAARNAASVEGSTARVRSHRIVVSKPRSTASSTVHFTQTSRARPQTKSRSTPRSRKYPERPVGGRSPAAFQLFLNALYESTSRSVPLRITALAYRHGRSGTRLAPGVSCTQWSGQSVCSCP